VLKSAYNYFKDMRNRYSADVKSSPTNSYETVISDQIANEDKSYQIFVDSPFCTFSGEWIRTGVDFSKKILKKSTIKVEKLRQIDCSIFFFFIFHGPLKALRCRRSL
jgi:hypothetical protein